MPLVKHNGSWVSATPHARHSGVWKPAQEIWVKKNGAWVREYTRDFFRIDGVYWYYPNNTSRTVYLGNGSTVGKVVPEFAEYPPVIRYGSFAAQILTLGAEFSLMNRSASEFPWLQLMRFQGDQSAIINSNYRYDVGDGVIRKVDRVYYGEEKYFGWGTYIEISQATANDLVNILWSRIGTQGYFRLIPPDML